MAKFKFPIVVTVGGKSFNPGDEVPMKKEDAEAIYAAHGRWSPDAQGSSANSALVAAKAEIEKLAKALKEVTAERDAETARADKAERDLEEATDPSE